MKDIDSDEELRRAVETADFMNPVDRFQQSKTVKTSKDAEAEEGLNLAIKRTKPNTEDPSSIPGPKTQEDVAFKNKKKKHERRENRQ